MSEICMFCHNRYVNHVNYCLMCGRVQSLSTPIAEPEPSPTISAQRYRRLTKEQQKTLMAEIQQGMASGNLNINDLSQKYEVSQSTVAYWQKKVEAQAS